MKMESHEDLRVYIYIYVSVKWTVETKLENRKIDTVGTLYKTYDNILFIGYRIIILKYQL